MSARSTRAAKRNNNAAEVVTIEAQVHAPAETEETSSPRPRRSIETHSRRTRPNPTTKAKKTKAKAKTKRVTVSDLSETVIEMQDSSNRQEARVERLEGRMDSMDSKL